MKKNSTPKNTAGPLLLAAALLLAAPAALAQTPGVGIGTSTPNAAAVLDLSSSTQGLLPPRLTTAQRDALTTAQNLGAAQAGLLIFNTTTQALNQWNGQTWTAPLVGDVGGGSGGTTFAFTGSPQTYVVPAGVTRLRVTAQGGTGGNYNGQTTFAPAALLTATVPVVPGETLTIVVGGQGGRNATTNPGGYNGGGQGGGSAGGGGGATDLRRASAAGATPDYLPARNALLVAAGSGGTDGGSAALGGSGGTPTGADGGSNAGSGASQTAPGGGIFAGANAQGGNSTTWGGGGGGYYGGGGGQTGAGAGGGGGSSWVLPTATAVRFGLAAAAGAGQLTLAPVTLPDQPGFENMPLGNLPWAFNTSRGIVPTDTVARVGIGTVSPRGRLDVRNGDSYLITNPNVGSAQTVYLPGHLFLAPFSGGSGLAYIQGRVPNPTPSTTIGLVLRTTNAGAALDALTLSGAGNAGLPGTLGVGTAAPVASAALEVSSTTKGLLPPRLTLAQRDVIASPAAGLTIYNTESRTLNVFDGSRWTASLIYDGPGIFTAPGTYTYVVPPGITTLVADLAGGQGGTPGGASRPPGLGGRVQARLTVTPGQVLTINVGGAGGVGGGGFNGGGAALGTGATGGGGGSDVRQGGTALADRVLVAGGGGGVRSSSSTGGAGGGLVGGNGTPGPFGDTGGNGGTQTAGGSSNGAGNDGTLGQGGAGAGGGGGGYYGGGGAFSTGVFSGAGGGGSGYAGAAASSVTFGSGVQAGNGYVRLQPVPPVGSGPILDGSNLANLPNPSGWTRTGTNVAPTVLTDNVGIGTAAPTSTLVVEGSEALAYTTSSTATFALTGAHRTVRRFGTCATITVPAASTCVGRLYTLINSNGQGAFTLTVTGGGSVYDDISNTTFSGANAFPAGTRLTFQSDGTGWIVVGR